MIEIRRVKFISRGVVQKFVPAAQKEWAVLKNVRTLLWAKTSALWVLYSNNEPLCVVGFIKTTLVGTGCDLYFFLCEKATAQLKSLFRFLKSALRKILNFYPLITVKVLDTFSAGKIFARKLNFTPVLAQVSDGTNNFTLFEMRK